MIGITTWSLVIWFAKESSCIHMMIINFIIDIFEILPTEIMFLVVVDRFLHIKYLSDYRNVYTSKRYKASLVFIMINSTTIASGSTAVAIFINARTSKVVLNILNLFFLFMACVIYGVSYRRLKEFQKQGGNLSNSSKEITQIAKLYLFLTIVVKVMPSIAQAVIQSLYGTLSPTLNVYITQIRSSYQIINAVIFMRVNTPARKYILQHILNRRTEEVELGENRNAWTLCVPATRLIMFAGLSIVIGVSVEKVVRNK